MTTPAVRPRSRTPRGAARPARRPALQLAAGERFAEQGYHAVSLRQIAAEAEVPLALVGYYFGAKHELFHAAFERWSPTIDARLALLREATTDRKRPTLRRIVQAFVDPVLALRASAEGEYYAMLVAGVLAYRSPDADRVLAE